MRRLVLSAVHLSIANNYKFRHYKRGKKAWAAMSNSLQRQEDLFPAASGPELIRAHQKVGQGTADSAATITLRVASPAVVTAAAWRWPGCHWLHPCCQTLPNSRSSTRRTSCTSSS